MKHHWYGHVEDVSSVDFPLSMITIPILIILGAFALATGLWLPLLIIWLLWPKGKK